MRICIYIYIYTHTLCKHLYPEECLSKYSRPLFSTFQRVFKLIPLFAVLENEAPGDPAHHPTPPHPTTPHHMPSLHIPSHPITSHHITSHSITSHPITSHHITSHHIASHHITSHRIILYQRKHAAAPPGPCHISWRKITHQKITQVKFHRKVPPKSRLKAPLKFRGRTPLPDMIAIITNSYYC